METLQTPSRKRKAETHVSPSQRKPPKSRKLSASGVTGPRVDQLRISPTLASPPGSSRKTSLPRASTSAAQCESLSGRDLGRNFSATQPSLSSKTATRTFTSSTQPKEPSTVSQRLSLTKPVYSAHTRIKRSKKGKERAISSGSSSELPESVLAGCVSTNNHAKNNLIRRAKQPH